MRRLAARQGGVAKCSKDLRIKRKLARTKDVVEFLKKSRGCMPRQSYFSRKEIEEPAYDRVGNAIVP